MDRRCTIDNVQQNFEDHEEREKLELLAEDIAELTNRIAELDDDSDEDADDKRYTLEHDIKECIYEFSYLTEMDESDIRNMLRRYQK